MAVNVNDPKAPCPVCSGYKRADNTPQDISSKSRTIMVHGMYLDIDKILLNNYFIKIINFALDKLISMMSILAD